MLSYSFIIEVFSKINIILNEYDSIVFEFNFFGVRFVILFVLFMKKGIKFVDFFVL